MNEPFGEDELLPRHRAFLLVNGQLLPVNVREDVRWEDLLGIDEQKQQLEKNLVNFLNGQGYNQTLLWGARGTGKSSLVRALFLRYQRRLAIVQISADDLTELPQLFWQLGQINQKFIVFIDDLSFASEDKAYRALKSVLDGAICAIPRNVFLLVTSNRRHLLAERHQDEATLHPEEEVEEHISLAERFGLRLAFHPLSQRQYLAAVRHWLKVDNLTAAVEQQALQFALARGSRSARVAEQFVKGL